MYVVFLLNKKHCIGYTIHVWCLIPVTYVSGKLHWCMYVAWCTKYSETGNTKAVYTYTSSPPVERGGGPVSNVTWLWGVLQCHMKFSGAGLLRNSNVMEEMDKKGIQGLHPLH